MFLPSLPALWPTPHHRDTFPLHTPLFDVLIFDLGPFSPPSDHIYPQNLRAMNAMDHFCLLEDVPSNESSGSFGDEPGSASSLRVPTRLKD